MTDMELRDLMDRTVDSLEPMADAVPEVLVTGRRSIRRRRTLAAATAVVGTAATVAAVTGLVNLTGGSNGTELPAAGVGSTATRQPGAEDNATGQPTREPSPAGRSTPSGTPSRHPGGSAEDKGEGRPLPQALRDYHRRVAPVLDKALPDRFGKVTAEKHIHKFTVRKGNRTYAITFRVDAEPDIRPMRCPDGPDAKDRKPTSCTERTLPNGWRAAAAHEMTGVLPAGTTLPLPAAETVYNGHRISLFMFNDERHAERVPISDDEMLDVFADPGFAAAIVEWASHPDWTDWTSPATDRPTVRPTR